MQFDMQPTVGVIAKQVDKLGADINSFKVPLDRSVRRVMAPSFQRNFDVGGRPRWEPLSEVTRVMKRQAGYGGSPIMERTGMLRKVVGQLNIWSIGRTGAAVTGNEQGWKRTHRAKRRDPRSVGTVAKIHQAGYRGSDRAAPIPARPFIMIHQRDAQQIEEIFADWLQERVADSMRYGLARGRHTR